MSLGEHVAKLLAYYNRPQEIPVDPGLSALIEGDAESAWSKVTDASLIPGHFAEDPRRRYAMVSETRLKFGERPPELRYPSSMDALRAVVARYPSMLQAEAYAREFADALLPWGGVCDDNVVWYFIRHPMDYLAYLGMPFNTAVSSISESVPDFEQIQNDMKGLLLPFLVRKTLAAYEGWERAISQKQTITLVENTHLGLDGALFSNLSNPFLPLIKVWETGHLTVSFFDYSDCKLRMYTTL